MKKNRGGRVWRGYGEALLRRDPETGQDSLQARGPTLPPLQTWGHVSSKKDSRASPSQATSTQQGHRAGLCTLRGHSKGTEPACARSEALRGQPGSESSWMLAPRPPGQQRQRASAASSRELGAPVCDRPLSCPRWDHAQWHGSSTLSGWQ